MLEKIHHSFHDYFDRLEYLIIHESLNLKNYTKNNDEKIIIFFNMHCDVYYYLHSLKLKFYLCMENKKDKLYYVVK